MNHEIRIAADWRCEMGIAGGRYTKMPFVLRTVTGLRQRSECHDLYDGFNLFSFHAFHKALHIFRLRFFRQFFRHSEIAIIFLKKGAYLRRDGHECDIRMYVP